MQPIHFLVILFRNFFSSFSLLKMSLLSDSRHNLCGIRNGTADTVTVRIRGVHRCRRGTGWSLFFGKFARSVSVHKCNNMRFNESHGLVTSETLERIFEHHRGASVGKWFQISTHKHFFQIVFDKIGKEIIV